MKTTLSGPGVDRAYKQPPSVVLSAAITHACRATEPATFYVRDDAGETVGRVERDDHGGILIFGAARLAAERRERVPFTPGA